MQKVILSAFFAFLLFGMLLHAPLVVAHDNETNETNSSGSTGNSDDLDENDSTVCTQDAKLCPDGSAVGRVGPNCEFAACPNKNETKNDSERYRERMLELEKKRIEALREKEKKDMELREKQREILKENGCYIKVQRTVTREENVVTEVIRKERICPNGERQEVKIRLENETENGTVKAKIKYEFEGEEHEVASSDDVNVEEDTSGDDYKLRAKVRGDITDIKIMPDRASQIALERLRSHDFTIELKEVGQKEGTTKVVYSAKVYKEGKLIGIIKKKVKIETEIDPETGEVIVTKKPWWAFFVAGEDSDQTGDDTSSGVDNNTGNSTNDTVKETPSNDTNSS